MLDYDEDEPEYSGLAQIVELFQLLFAHVPFSSQRGRDALPWMPNK